MRRIYLFTEFGELSPARKALTGLEAEVTHRTLHPTWLDCPIALPPDLVVLEPAPLRNLSPLAPLLATHPVVARVPWLLVADPERIHQAAALPCADFIVRGFAPSELVARIERLFGHRPARETVLRCGTVTLDLQSLTAKVGEKLIPLTPQEFSLLRHFMLNPERPMSRDQLLEKAWGRGYQGGPRTVDVHVRRLRACLGPEAVRLETLRHLGYRFRV